MPGHCDTDYSKLCTKTAFKLLCLCWLHILSLQRSALAAHRPGWALPSQMLPYPQDNGDRRKELGPEEFFQPGSKARTHTSPTASLGCYLLPPRQGGAICFPGVTVLEVPLKFALDIREQIPLFLHLCCFGSGNANTFHQRDSSQSLSHLVRHCRGEQEKL